MKTRLGVRANLLENGWYNTAVGKHDKLLRKILSGRSDANVDFHELRSLLLHLGLNERVRGSHHIFFREDIKSFLNLQSTRGKAKPYQVRQTREFIVLNQLAEE